MIAPELLQILCCPETLQELAVADAQIVSNLNGRIASGTLTNRAGAKVAERIDGALIRKDGKYAYLVRDKIPVMLIDEAVPL